MIRPAREDDLPLIPAIEASAATLFADIGLPIPDGGGASPVAYWRPALDQETLWVAVDDHDRPVGYVACVSYGATLYVQQIDVHRDQQRQGLGKAMMQVAIARAWALGREAVALTTFRKIAFNAPFYASLGFVETADPPAWLADIVAEERGRGLRGRCAMLLKLAD